MSAPITTSSHVRSMIDPDGAVLLDLEKGKYFSLNAVGMEIWRKVEERASRREILEHLGNTFQAPRGQLEEDLEVFIRSLSEKGLIHVPA